MKTKKRSVRTGDVRACVMCVKIVHGLRAVLVIALPWFTVASAAGVQKHQQLAMSRVEGEVLHNLAATGCW